LILETIKQTLQPSSMTLLLVLLATGVALLYTRSTVARQGRRWLTLVVLAYWMLSSPLGAGLLARTLTGPYRPLESPAEAPGVQAVVMLSGGSRTIRASGGHLQIATNPTVLRALETARLYRLLGDPLVILSGGITETRAAVAYPESDAMKATVIALGVPAGRVIVESESKNTRDEAVVLKRMLAELRVDRFVIVTSPLHMRRSLAAFKAQDLHPVPSPSALHADRNVTPFPLMPSDASLEVGNAVIYEWSALAYYWWRGWL
jgi:uncharacterized SAM-binding protein YcdF (DUF218 family)